MVWAEGSMPAMPEMVPASASNLSCTMKLVTIVQIPGMRNSRSIGSFFLKPMRMPDHARVTERRGRSRSSPSKRR